MKKQYLTILLLTCSLPAFLLQSCKTKRKSVDKTEEMIYDEMADTAMARYGDTLRSRIVMLDSLIASIAITDHVEESVDNPRLADSLNQGLILGEMTSSGNLCKGLTYGNTAVIEIEQLSKLKNLTKINSLDEGYFGHSYDIENIRKKLENPSYKMGLQARDINATVGKLLGLKFFVIEDTWMYKKPEITGDSTFNGGIILKKVCIYELQRKMLVQSFFLAKQSSHEVKVHILNKEDLIFASPATIKNELYDQYSKKRDTLLFSL